MVMQHLVKIKGVVWIILNDINDTLYLKQPGVDRTARYYKNSGKLVYKHIFSGKFKSEKVKLC